MAICLNLTNLCSSSLALDFQTVSLLGQPIVPHFRSSSTSNPSAEEVLSASLSSLSSVSIKGFNLKLWKIMVKFRLRCSTSHWYEWKNFPHVCKVNLKNLPTPQKSYTKFWNPNSKDNFWIPPFVWPNIAQCGGRVGPRNLFMSGILILLRIRSSTFEILKFQEIHPLVWPNIA